ncbi:MAG: histidine phosphatase family protein [Armatimonadetes bacterium]|nr:histidine phosphatase family protein [Armatimonadota bacterium]
MKTLILVRHGEADHHIRGLTGGWTNSHLTDLGRGQCERAGRRLAEMLDEGAALYSSDLPRAAQAAAIIGELTGLEVRFDEGLREFNNGEAADITWEEAAKIQQPPSLPLIDYVPYPGAECWREMNERVYAAMERIATDNPEVAVIINHTLSGVAVVHWWLGNGPEQWERISFDFDPCSITVLGVNDFRQRAVMRLNDTSHLLGLGGDEDGEVRLPGVKR